MLLYKAPLVDFLRPLPFDLKGVVYAAHKVHQRVIGVSKLRLVSRHTASASARSKVIGFSIVLLLLTC